MIYTVAISSAGQLTIPKELREFLGITDKVRKVRLEKGRNGVDIKRRLSHAELRQLLDSHISDRAREVMAQDRGRGVVTVGQIKKEMAKDPKVQARWKEKYGN